MLVSPAKRDQNEMGDSKNEIGFDVHHIYEHIDVKDWKTRPIMVEKCQNLRNEIKTRWGDSVNLLYWGHRTNKSRRIYIYIYTYRSCTVTQAPARSTHCRHGLFDLFDWNFRVDPTELPTKRQGVLSLPPSINQYLVILLFSEVVPVEITD